LRAIQFYQRRSAGVCDSGPTHPILHRKHLLIINELHQIALLKVAKHLDFAHPSAIITPTKMGTLSLALSVNIAASAADTALGF
jgi:thiamine pyrophosphate-dependent acetolactate synthase large subunit-like protein